MKKVKLSIVASLAILLTSFSFSQGVEKGNVIIDPYYGGPNFGKKFAESFDLKDGASVSGIGPCGLRFEYMVADKFGLGFDFIYNSFSVKGTADSLRTDGTVYQTYDVKATAARYRFQARFNYHFVQEDNVDAYVGFGAGTNIRVGSVKTDFPNYDDEAVSGALIPVSFRIALGMRYYFTNNIGINAEIGLGGPVMSAGLSFKF